MSKKEECKLTGKEILEKKLLPHPAFGQLVEITYVLFKDKKNETLYFSEKSYEKLTTDFRDRCGWLIPCAQIHKKFDLGNLVIYDKAVEDLSSDERCISLEQLEGKIEKIGHYPKTQEEKFNNIFLSLLNFQKYDGEMILVGDFSNAYPYDSLYFKNWSERNFYLHTLMSRNLIAGLHDTAGNVISREFRITYEGLNYGIELQQTSAASNQCFVAMSFAEEMKPYREAIKDACRELGYQAMLIDEAHYDADQTINDAMIVEIKRSKFCVADFTHQRQNVYFEAGYALGIGIPVIYACHAEDMDDRHFDTRHFPHISYSSTDQLKKELKTKIEAWII